MRSVLTPQSEQTSHDLYQLVVVVVFYLIWTAAKPFAYAHIGLTDPSLKAILFQLAILSPIFAYLHISKPLKISFTTDISLTSLLALIIGIILFNIGFSNLGVFLWEESGTASGHNTNYLVLEFISAVLLAPVLEETIFRLHIYSRLKNFTNLPVVSVLITSCLFAAAHGFGASFMVIFSTGLALGYIFMLTHNITICIVLHAVINCMAWLANFNSTKSTGTGESTSDLNILMLLSSFTIFTLIGWLLIYRTTKNYE